MIILLILIGAFIGGAIAEWSGVVIGAMFGGLASSVLDLKQKFKGQSEQLDKLQQNFNQLSQHYAKNQFNINRTKESLEAEISDEEPQTTSDQSPDSSIITNPSHIEPPKQTTVDLQTNSEKRKITLSNVVANKNIELEDNLSDTASQPPTVSSEGPSSEQSSSQQRTAALIASNRSTPKTQPLIPRAPNFLDKAWGIIKSFFITGNPIVKVASLVLFFGVAFLLKYAADNNYFPIEWRLVSVATIATGLLVWSFRLPKRHRQYSLIVQGAAIGILYLTVYAASSLYQLLPLKVAFIFLFILAVLGAILAVKQNSSNLAIVSVIGGFIAPILTSSGSNAYVQLFSYYAVLNVGILLISLFKSWRHLSWLGFFFTFFIGSIWGYQSYQPEFFQSTEPFLIFHFLFYLTIPMLFLRLKQKPEKAIVQTTIVFGLPTISFALQILMTENYVHGDALSALAWSFCYFLAAFVLYKLPANNISSKNNLLRSYLAIGTTFFTIFIFFLFNRDVTSVLWAFEAVGLVWLGLRQKEKLPRFAGLIVLALSAIVFVNNYSQAPERLLFLNDTFIPSAIIVIATLTIGLLYFKTQNNHNQLLIIENSVPSILLPSAVAGWLLSGIVELYTFVEPNTFLHSSLLYFAVTSLILMFSGKWLKWPSLSRYAIVLWPTLILIPAVHFAQGPHQNPFANLGLISYLPSLTISYILTRLLKSLIGNSVLRSLQSISMIVTTFILSWFVHYYFAPIFAAMIWALQAALLVWYGLFRQKIIPRCAGILLLFSAYILLVVHVEFKVEEKIFFNLTFASFITLAISAMTIGFCYYRSSDKGIVSVLESKLPLIFLATGLVTWYFIAHIEIQEKILPEYLIAATVLFVSLSSILFISGGNFVRWPHLSYSSLFIWPVLLLTTARRFIAAYEDNPMLDYGWLYLPISILISYVVIVLLKRYLAEFFLNALKSINLLFVTFLLTWVCAAALYPASNNGDWHPLMFGFIPALLLLIYPLSEKALSSIGIDTQHFKSVKLSLAGYLALWLLISMLSTLHPENIVFLPFLNPLDLVHLFTTYLLYQTIKSFGYDLFSLFNNNRKFKYSALFISFLWLNIIIARSFHHIMEIPFAIDALFASPIFQTTISILWSLLAIVIMLLSKKYQSRSIWFIGISILSAIVIKLLTFDLADSGTLARIISFLAVGAVMLAIGYFAPMPPKQELQDDHNDHTTNE